MFDIYQTRSGPSSVSVNVTEKRAPTDESVRLLREMEAAAQKKADQTIRLKDCPVDCVIQCHEDYRNAQREFRILAKVGGRRIEAIKRIDYGSADNHDDIAREMVRVLAEQIAITVLAPAFAKIDRHLLKG